MSPYREAPQQPSTKPRARIDLDRGAGVAMVLVSACMGPLCFGVRMAPKALHFALGMVLLSFVAGVWIALRGKGQGAHARLARLTWHRGRPVRATLLAIGLVSPRCSPKRLARYRAINQAKVIEAGVLDPLRARPGRRRSKMLLTILIEALSQPTGRRRAAE